MIVQQLVTDWLVAAGVGTVGAAVVVAFCLRMARNAIATAVRQAGEVELANLKARLDYQFETMLAQQRSMAERSLEQFKSELTIKAEVRRMLATRRLDATLDIIKAAMPLSQGPELIPSGPVLLAHFETFWSRVEKHRVLFPSSVEAQIKEFSRMAMSAQVRARKGEPWDSNEFVDITNTLVERLRRQIGVIDEPTPPE